MLLILTIKFKLEYKDVLDSFKNHQNYSSNNDASKTIEFAVDGHVASNNLQGELETLLSEMRIENYKFNKEW